MSKAAMIKIIGGSVLLCILLLLAIWIFGGFQGLTEHGAGALIAGVVASMFLGIGLMVAVFASHRLGHDEVHYDVSSTDNAADTKPADLKDVQ